MSRLRVLVASHSHPRLTNGGSEVAAYRLFTELNALEGTEAWFLGCSTRPGAGRDGVALTQPFGEREFLYAAHGQFDGLKFANRDPRLPREFAELLRLIRPDVVHLHHYTVFGVELLQLIRRTLPDARIIMTLHEYLAICHHYGQMVKSGDFALCYESGPEACHRCFPDIDAADFFIRQRYIGLFFDQVDQFVSPSAFLASRYAAWGIDQTRLSVIANITAPPAMPLPPVSDGMTPEALAIPRPLRLGFFGQVSRLKGTGVMMECARAMNERGDVEVTFDIFGDYRNQPEPFQEHFLKDLGASGRCVNFRGAYRQDQVDRLMRSVDAVLVPSIWWENSPVVIEEAIRNNRPIICSDIGGMAEKVEDGIDGFHFRAGSSQELGFLIRRLYDNPGLLETARQTMRRPDKVETIVALHMDLYTKKRTKKLSTLEGPDPGRLAHGEIFPVASHPQQA